MLGYPKPLRSYFVRLRVFVKTLILAYDKTPKKEKVRSQAPVKPMSDSGLDSENLSPDKREQSIFYFFHVLRVSGKSFSENLFLVSDPLHNDRNVSKHNHK